MGITANSKHVAKRLRAKARRIWRRRLPGMAPGFWTPATVSVESLPEANLRSYLERKGLRALLSEIPIELASATEIGCGFGRLTMTLTEFAQETIGYEREPQLASMASTLLPEVRIENVDSLCRLPIGDDYFSFAMTFTVLQHMVDQDVECVISELKRITKSISYVLLVESTAPQLEVNPDEPGVFTKGRPIDTYATLMEPYSLVRTAKREVGPTWPHDDVGHYMLFSRQ